MTILAIALTMAGTTLSAPLATTSNNNIEQRSGQTYNGDITYYAPGLGACGWTNTDAEHVAALSPSQFSSGTNCGKTITINKDGKSVKAKVVDLCPGCASGGVDVSSTAFGVLANLDVGRTTVAWSFD